MMGERKERWEGIKIANGDVHALFVSSLPLPRASLSVMIMFEKLSSTNSSHTHTQTPAKYKIVNCFIKKRHWSAGMMREEVA